MPRSRRTERRSDCLRKDLAAFKGHIDAKIDAHGARIDLLEARVVKTAEDVAFIKGLLTGGGQRPSRTVARLIARRLLYQELVG